jgi:hypothetical protein
MPLFFKEHRHDQSIFSILFNRHQVIDIDVREIICWGTDQKTVDWDVLSNYPIHAKRYRNLSRRVQLQRRWRKLQKNSPNSAKGWRLNRSHDRLCIDCIDTTPFYQRNTGLFSTKLVMGLRRHLKKLLFKKRWIDLTAVFSEANAGGVGEGKGNL